MWQTSVWSLTEVDTKAPLVGGIPGHRANNSCPQNQNKNCHKRKKLIWRKLAFIPFQNSQWNSSLSLRSN